MAITINEGILGKAPAPEFNFAMLSGVFGSMPAGEMGICPDANTALIGWEKVTPATKNHPSPEAQYGVIWSIDTMGCGNSGKRRIPVNTILQEWVYQLALMNDNSVMMRQRINKGAWGVWLRWL
ncbi:hypothetical protein C3432_07900 [Citrobacter amalonaticus]|uniref:Uncharacterized protein n=1 Tax=Citrobacter amalonaticus TaxID=35703 RepID=A0A2S4RY20_CITAM|nr:hypothetical protein [Citrobacter amalonaticus]POT57852.1 hypothetical protein C3432_07900 [Citrobacter amalonaticus]POT76621.1 hypothetical protein C3436_03925 [Citrobacter amalonaticus]POU65700.1 hypothetical protein C3430_10340 [Citrobacter amalonaticus]POV05857.1 hypothetical protein C3424_11225 [Citrobacter amalonaticus]